MKKYKRYSAGFKEQALVKVYRRGNDQTIRVWIFWAKQDCNEIKG
jgi:hypothetical protein